MEETMYRAKGNKRNNRSTLLSGVKVLAHAQAMLVHVTEAEGSLLASHSIKHRDPSTGLHGLIVPGSL
jgi:hypothetical protein